MDRERIEKKARELIVKMWTNECKSTGRKIDPFYVLDPSYIARQLGLKFVEAESLGNYRDKGTQFEVAGIIDRQNNTISISNRFDENIKRFTAAHEIGHYILHSDLVSHRDKPISGPSIVKDLIEREADYFATCLLMPRRLVIDEFKLIFGSLPLRIDETLCFALGYKNDKEFFAKRNKPLFYELLLAKASMLNTKGLKSLASRFGVSAHAMAIRLEELKVIGSPEETTSEFKYDNKPQWQNKNLEKSLYLATTQQCTIRQPGINNVRLVIIQHALRDTYIFLKILIDAGATIGAFIAKPNSINQIALDNIKKLGVPVHQEINSDFKPYHFFENTLMLDNILVDQLQIAKRKDQKITMIDVGGYFAIPVSRLSKSSLKNISGIVEVTTFGHNRYEKSVETLPVPVISIAKSPLKEAEAIYVGESIVRATEDLIHSLGKSLSGKVCVVVGFGMIGSEIAFALQKKNIRTIVVDLDPVKSIKAKLKHFETMQLKEIIQDTDIIFSSTGNCAVGLKDLTYAKSGILLVSGGSRANEFDISEIKRDSVKNEYLIDYVEQFEMSNGQNLLLANNGKAVNFLKDGTPEEIMDIVFAEQVEAVRTLDTAKPKVGRISEVSKKSRDLISKIWAKNQNTNSLTLSKKPPNRERIRSIVHSLEKNSS